MWPSSPALHPRAFRCLLRMTSHCLGPQPLACALAVSYSSATTVCTTCVIYATRGVALAV
eukprot:scaffold8700_cov31-Tisochrysis_lutea.AAC.10